MTKSNQPRLTAFFDALAGSKSIAPLTVSDIGVTGDNHLVLTGKLRSGQPQALNYGLINNVVAVSCDKYQIKTDRYLVSLDGVASFNAISDFLRELRIKIDNGSRAKDSPSFEQVQATVDPTVLTRASLFAEHHSESLRNGISAILRIDRPDLTPSELAWATDLGLYTYLVQLLGFIAHKDSWFVSELPVNNKRSRHNAYLLTKRIAELSIKTESAKTFFFSDYTGFKSVGGFIMSCDMYGGFYSGPSRCSYVIDRLMTAASANSTHCASGFHAATIEYVSLLADLDGLRTKEELSAIETLKSIPASHRHSPSSAPTSEIDLTMSQISVEDSLAELNSLTGLRGVKDYVKELICVQSNNKERKAAGLRIVEPSNHMIFLGNPGTGKTTVARILGRIYRELGILSKGHFVEASRSDIIGAYIGETAVKTRKLLDAALGGILFVDEAYSLIQGDPQGDQFSKEAIDEILKYMEDNRTDLIVIAAGYKREMQGFMNSNPGLKSRFTHLVEFADFDVHELMEIFISLLNDYGYAFGSEADREHFWMCLTRLKLNASERFGNGRTVRSMFEKTVKNQARRRQEGDFLKQGARDDLQVIRALDLPVEDLVAIH